MPGRENHSEAEALFPFRSKVFITWWQLLHKTNTRQQNLIQYMLVPLALS
jgi:hypothetical protein